MPKLLNIQIAIKAQKPPEVWRLEMKIWQNVIILHTACVGFSSAPITKCVVKIYGFY